jgi:hypothetical protein
LSCVDHEGLFEGFIRDVHGHYEFDVHNELDDSYLHDVHDGLDNSVGGPDDRKGS